jgi:hypothetical protein
VETQGRDLLRRRLALALVVAVPLAFYLVTFHDTAFNSIFIGGVGMAFAIAAFSLFATLAASRTDPRLVLAGYRPVDLLLGRLILLEALAVALVVLFGIVFYVGSDPYRPGRVVVALLLNTIVAVPLALAVGAILPRELEATLVIIGIIGVQEVTHPGAVLAPVIPFYGPARLFENAGASLGISLVHTLLYSAALLLFAVFVWRRRLGVGAASALA